MEVERKRVAASAGQGSHQNSNPTNEVGSPDSR